MAFVSDTLPGVGPDVLATNLPSDPANPAGQDILDPLFGVLDKGLDAFARFQDLRLRADLIKAGQQQNQLLHAVEVPANVQAVPVTVANATPAGFGLSQDTLILAGLAGLAALFLLK